MERAEETRALGSVKSTYTCNFIKVGVVTGPNKIESVVCAKNSVTINIIFRETMLKFGYFS